MGLVARNPEEDMFQQGSGAPVGSPPEYATGTVHLDAVADDGTVTHHTQRFESGDLVQWTLADAPGPWAIVRPGDPTERVSWASVAPPELVESTKIRVGEEVFDLPPLDDLPSPGFASLPRVPDATARLRFELIGTPVGRILSDIRYQDGRRPLGTVVGEWPERTRQGEPAHDAPEMSVRMTFANYLRVRSGEKDFLEAIEDGGDVGDSRWTLLLLLHGIAQTAPYLAIYRSLPRFPAETGWWGEAAAYIDSDMVPAAASN